MLKALTEVRRTKSSHYPRNRLTSGRIVIKILTLALTGTETVENL